MIVITMKNFDVVLGITRTISKSANEGYIRLDDCGFIVKKSGYNFIEIEEVPNEIVPYKYCYTEEKGFYENPNWVEPEVEDPIQEYRDQLASEVSEIGYNA